MKRPAVKIVFVLAIVACLLFLLAAGGIYSVFNDLNVEATRTVEVVTVESLNLTKTIVVEETTVDVTTRLASAAAGTATTTAMTAEAEGDDDGDGLSNGQELELGTDPDNRDSDGDGLTDGQETNQIGTDPTDKDTDGDNLPDGTEVNEYGTSPLNPDTDGDGVSDAEEINSGVDPLQPPTKSATPGTVQPSSVTPPATETVATIMEIAAVGFDVGMTEEGQFTTQVTGELGPGTMDFTVPKEMAEGDSAAASLSLDLNEDFVAADSVMIVVAEMVAAGTSPSEQPEHHVVEDVTLFEEMSAHLSGVNFDIVPETPVSKHILPGNETVWNWTITPKNRGNQSLGLEIFVLFTDESGDIDKVWLYDNIFLIAVDAGSDSPDSLEATTPAATPAVTMASTPIKGEPADDALIVASFIVLAILAVIIAATASFLLYQRRRDDETLVSSRSSTAGYADLQDAIDEHFSEEELKTLCFALGIEYANLPARTKTNRVWDLIAYCDRAGQISQLIKLCEKERPNIDWAALA